jgi:hypothetical protein
VDADVEEVAARLYAVPPDQFVAARDEEVRRARAQGRRELADALRRLRRPTQAAWLVNLLVREHGDTVEELLSSSERFKKAYESGDGDLLRELSARRARLTTDLVRAARRIGTREGVRVTADTVREIERTLGAALVDPDVAERLRGGRLAAPAEYAGFGPAWPAPPPSAPGQEAGRGGEEPSGAPRQPQRRRPARPVREPERREGPSRRSTAESERHDERVRAARSAVEEAERELAEREAALEEATRRRTEAEREVEAARAHLRDVEKRLAALDRGVRAESKRRERAADALASARRRLAQVTRRSP